MPWWGWVITGTVLFGAEMFGVSAQFYLVFLGAAAIAVGLIGALGIALPDWAQWLTFAALAVVCMFAFRERVFRRFRGDDETVEAPIAVGASIRVPEALAPGASCRVDYRGSTWNARNIDQAELAAGSDAVIAEVAGLTLHLRRAAAH